MAATQGNRGKRRRNDRRGGPRIVKHDVKTFYDKLAENYHLIFSDWDASVRRQGNELNQLLRTACGDGPLSVLDCACGIGTQAIGLAMQPGFTVTGTDLSPQAVERAKHEAARLGADVTFAAADMRDLGNTVTDTFDVVLAYDNALPHLLTEDDLAAALRSVHARLQPGGLFTASIRDYDALLAEKPQAMSHRVMPTAEGKRISFQLWEWQADQYTVTQFIVTPDGTDWQLSHITTRYWALQRATLTKLLLSNGFRDVRWQMPDESGFFQPVVLAIRE